MKSKRFIGIFLSVCMVLCMMMGLVGCQAAQTPEQLLENMKEFSLPNGTASLYLNKEWKEQEIGVDNFLVVGADDGTKAVFVFQFPKDGSYQAESIDDVKDVVKQSYQISEEQEMEAFAIPGMDKVEAWRCKMSLDGGSGEAYVAYGETDYAFYALGYVASRWSDTIITVFQTGCSKFVETPPEVEDWTTCELTDTIRWFNASYAVLTEINGWDYNRFGGLPANEETKEQVIGLLKEWWSVTDTASAEETLDWILTEGHRDGFADDMEYLEEIGLGEASDKNAFLLENFDMSAEEAANYEKWYAMYEQYGEEAINGWDYCRALNLLSYYYIAGYCTETEALDKSLEIAKEVQTEFDSWDDLMESYLRGYEYWAEESSAERKAVYEELKAQDDNPYQVDFKMTLEKTW